MPVRITSNFMIIDSNFLLCKMPFVLHFFKEVFRK